MIKGLLRVSVLSFLLLHTSIGLAERTKFITSHFSGSGNCSSCHDGMIDNQGKDVSIVKDWGNSMMANATKDPFWLAKVATELERNPALSTVINDKCTKCHAPVAHYEITKVQGAEMTLFGPDGILKPEHALYEAGMDGVTCTVCHQITNEANLGTLDGFSGHYNINDSKTIYGQFDNLNGQPMVRNTGYTPTYSAHISDSAVCATCHNLKTPYVDANGNILTTTPETEFPEQMPYTEWQNSVFDDAGSNPQSCQDCHMPKTTAPISVRPNGLASRAGFAKHELVGANTTMLTLLRDNSTQLDVMSENLDQSISSARTMLQSAASVEFVSATVVNGVLEARVKLQNNSGHKTPTSYPSRRMWLNFKVTDSNNNVVFESGHINANGSIDGVDNDVDQSLFEPHYNTITTADQVQVYETVLGDSDDNVTFTLLRSAQYLKDNRLTPQGFNKLAVPDDVAVRGLAFTDADFNQGSDEIVYRFPVAVTGTLDVSVSLNYQTISHGFLQDLYRDNQLPEVLTFKSMYDAQSLKHEEMTSAQTTVVSDYVTPPVTPVVTLSATPSTITQGQSAVISWSVSDANSCSASGGWNGNRATSDSETVSPATTTSYTLNCTGDGGSDNKTITVNVNPVVVPAPVVTLSVTPSTITQGQSAVISWSVSDASSCSASGGWNGSRATNDSETVSPATTTNYTLTCSGDGGSDNKTITVSVNPLVVAAPVVTLSAAPTTIDQGQSSVISWSASDANSCSATGGWNGSRATSGNETVSPTTSTNYALDCTGNGGSDNKIIYITVNAVTVPAPVITLSVTPSSITQNQTANISWNVSNANSCIASGGWSGSRAVSGNESLSPQVTTTYALECSGAGGTINDSLSIVVNSSTVTEPGTGSASESSSGGAMNPVFLLFLVMSQFLLLRRFK